MPHAPQPERRELAIAMPWLPPASASATLNQPTSSTRFKNTAQVNAQERRKPVALPPGPLTEPKIEIPNRTTERKIA